MTEFLKNFDGYEVIKNAKYGRVYITLYKPLKLKGGSV